MVISPPDRCSLSVGEFGKFSCIYTVLLLISTILVLVRCVVTHIVYRFYEFYGVFEMLTCF